MTHRSRLQRRAAAPDAPRHLSLVIDDAPADAVTSVEARIDAANTVVSQDPPYGVTPTPGKLEVFSCLDGFGVDQYRYISPVTGKFQTFKLPSESESPEVDEKLWALIREVERRCALVAASRAKVDIRLERDA